ncbi:unnamed protein product [Pedinophyceae sp. YPF-701]|nr:unnamed protein product [Pedinophyceae sp. YPF-701]
MVGPPKCAEPVPKKEPKIMTNDEKARVKEAEAKLLGLFSSASYVDVGDPVRPVEYERRAPERSNFRGSQFKTNPPKQGATPDVFFQYKIAQERAEAEAKKLSGMPKEEQLNYLRKTRDTYEDKMRFRQEALGKLAKTMGDDFNRREVKDSKLKGFANDQNVGFASSDISKRSEFTMTFRTEQYREQLSQETKYAKRAMEMMHQTGEHAELVSPRKQKEEEDGPLLYDLVFEDDDWHAQASRPAFSRVHRDTVNPTRLSKERHMGGMRTTNNNTFRPPVDFNKPEFGHKPLIRDTFYRKTNVRATFPVPMPEI